MKILHYLILAVALATFSHAQTPTLTEATVKGQQSVILTLLVNGVPPNMTVEQAKVLVTFYQGLAVHEQWLAWRFSDSKVAVETFTARANMYLLTAAIFEELTKQKAEAQGLSVSEDNS